MPTEDDGCFVCRKHALGDDAEGGVIYRDGLVYAGHMHTMGRPTVYRGYLMVEPVRHVAGWGDLTDEEAGAVGRLVNRMAMALRAVEAAEHVYSFVFGGGVPHLHVHVVPRYAGTPREYWATRLQEWPDAPQVDPVAMRTLSSSLASWLAGSA